MNSHLIEVYKFVFKGIEGKIEVKDGLVSIYHGNTRANISSSSVDDELRKFVLKFMKRDCGIKFWK